MTKHLFMELTLNLNWKIIQILKDIFKEENIIWYDSAYGGQRFGFKFDKEKAEKENPELFTSGKFIDLYLKLICEMTHLNEDFINDYGFEEGHINLLRRSYFYTEDASENSFNLALITIQYKRPFGNSYVLGDVLGEFGIPQFDENGNKLDVSGYEYLIDDTMNKIKDFLINHTFEEIEAVYHGYYFTPTERYLRNCKIDKIINEE
jgi:hypothetical protein